MEKNKSGAVWFSGAEVLTVPKIISHWTAQNLSNLWATLKLLEAGETQNPPHTTPPRPSSSDIGTGQTELARTEQTVFHIDGSEVVRHNLQRWRFLGSKLLSFSLRCRLCHTRWWEIKAFMFWKAGGQAEFMEGTQQMYWSLSSIDENRLLHQRLSANLSLTDYSQTTYLLPLYYGPTLLNSHHACCNVPASDRKLKKI